MMKLENSKAGMPTFNSNGLSALIATGSEAQVTIMERQKLETLFGAELIAENIRYNPYWQIGEHTGNIYRLGHFPIDGTDVDFCGLLVFNIEPSDMKSKFEVIVSGSLFDSLNHSDNQWSVHISDNIQEAVKRANEFASDLLP